MELRPNEYVELFNELIIFGILDFIIKNCSHGDVGVGGGVGWRGGVGVGGVVVVTGFGVFSNLPKNLLQQTTRQV